MSNIQALATAVIVGPRNSDRTSSTIQEGEASDLVRVVVAAVEDLIARVTFLEEVAVALEEDLIVEEEEAAAALVNNKDPSIIKVVVAANLRHLRFLVQRWHHQMRAIRQYQDHHILWVQIIIIAITTIIMEMDLIEVAASKVAIEADLMEAEIEVGLVVVAIAEVVLAVAIEEEALEVEIEEAEALVVVIEEAVALVVVDLEAIEEEASKKALSIIRFHLTINFVLLNYFKI